MLTVSIWNHPLITISFKNKWVFKIFQMFWFCLTNIEPKTKETFAHFVVSSFSAPWLLLHLIVSSYFKCICLGVPGRLLWRSCSYVDDLGPFQATSQNPCPRQISCFFLLILFLGPAPSSFSTPLTPPLVEWLQHIWLQSEILLPKPSFLEPLQNINMQVLFLSRFVLLITRGKIKKGRQNEPWRRDTHTVSFSFRI